MSDITVERLAGALGSSNPRGYLTNVEVRSLVIELLQWRYGGRWEQVIDPGTTTRTEADAQTHSSEPENAPETILGSKTGK